jgi:hypothetical protein
MNRAAFLVDPNKWFANSYAQFKVFGGPCVYFHTECLKAGKEDFLGKRHLEMMYATLTAWGLHRMGDAQKTKAKLKEWVCFRDSIAGQKAILKQFRGESMLGMKEDEYSQRVADLRPCYDAFNLSESESTVVVNSKALHHILPELIPPIDRQYTIRFFKHLPEKWLNRKGKFNQISLPGDREEQFDLFRRTCVQIKQLADKIEPAIFEDQTRRFEVAAPKAVDNAIVTYVRSVVTRFRPSLKMLT